MAEEHSEYGERLDELHRRIAQRLGGTLKFDTNKRQITNNERANQLIKGNAPRKGWEEYYKM